MNRYPDEIIILQPLDNGTPYKAAQFKEVYKGRCRCFLDRQAAFRINKIMDCTYQVVIPDRYMPEIGENFKVGVKMHTNKSNHNWDLVGYVKDFARYDRVCNLYFQMVKENLIYEDMPPVGYDLTERTVVAFEDDYLHLESEGLLMNGEHLVQNTVTRLWFKDDDYRLLIVNNTTESDSEEVIYDSDLEDDNLQETSMTRYVGQYEDENGNNSILIVPVYQDGDEEYKPKITFRIEKETFNEETQEEEYEVIYEKYFVILE